MDKQEAIEMLSRAETELTALRAEIDRLRPRAEAFDALQSVLGLLPGKSQGYGQDWAWTFRRRREQIEKELEAELAQEAVAK